MADVTEIIKRLIVEAQTRGFDKAAAEFQSFTSAVSGAGTAATAAGAATTTAQNKLGSFGRELERASGRADPLGKELKNVTKDILTFNKALEQGLISPDQSARLKQGRVEQTSTAKAAAAAEAAAAKQAADAEIAALARVDAAQEQFQRKAQQRVQENVAFEERIATARHAQERAEFGRAAGERAGIGAPAATTRGAGFSALAEREANAQKAQVEEAKHVTQALKEQQQQHQALQQSAASLRQQLDPLGAAQAKHAASVEHYGTMLRQGLITQKEFTQAVAQSQAGLHQTASGLLATATAGQKIGPAIGLARHEMINFSRQLQDIGVSLASGQSAMMVFVQQVPQIADVFMTSQTSLKGFATQMGSMAARFGPLIAGLGAVATAVYAVNKALDEQLESRQALGGGRGRFLQATPEDINRAAERAAGGGQTLGEAREGILAGVRAGGPDLKSIEQAAALAKRYATTIQSDLAPAQKELADLIGDRTTASYTAAANKLGAYSAATADNIRTLQSQGQFAQAAKVALDSITGAVVAQKDATSTLADSWAQFLSTTQRELNALAKLIQNFPRMASPAVPSGTGEERRGSSGAFARAARREADERAPETATPSIGREGLAIAAEMQAQAEAMSRADAAIAKSTAEATLRQENIANAVARATEAHRLQVDVLNAVSAGQKAAAAEAQTYEQALRQLDATGKETISTEEARAKAILAGAEAMAQARAQSRRGLEDKQEELGGAQEKRAAFGGGASETEMAEINARIAEETALRQAGLGVKQQEIAIRQAEMQVTQLQAQLLATTNAAQAAAIQQQIAGLQSRMASMSIIAQESQARIALAGSIARETAALQDQVQARNVLKQAEVQAAGLQADISSIDQEQSARTALIATAQLEVQVMQLLAAGKTEEAAATLASGQALIALTQQRDEATAAAQREAEAEQQLAAAQNAAAQQSAAAANRQAQAAESARRAWIAARQAEFDRIGIGGFGGPSAMGRSNADLKQIASRGAEPQPGQIHGANARLQTGVIMDPHIKAMADMQFGEGNWMPELGLGASTGGPWSQSFRLFAKPIPEKVAAAKAQGRETLEGISRQALQSAIDATSRAIGKQIQGLRDTIDAASDFADQASDLGEQASAARQKQRELESEIKEQEDRRQQRIQQYLGAGPSPLERNVDIFYDPKKRLAFAETIAGNTDELLKQQMAQAKAEADAFEAQQKAAEAQQKALEDQAKATEAQIEALEDQQEKLTEQAELIEAGVDLSKQEVDGINALINEIKTGLPANIATQFARIFSAQQGQAAEQMQQAIKAMPGGAQTPYVLETLAKTSAGMGASSMGFTGVGGQGQTVFGGTFDPYNTTSKLNLPARGLQHGGEFIVPGSYSAGDRPFVVGLAGQEKVTVQTPAQQAATRRTRGAVGTSIENLIVQMPPATNPIEYMNKRSRPALGRAVRGMARGLS